MLKHYDFDCSFVGLRLLPNSGVSSISNLNDPVSGPLCPELWGMATVIRSLDPDLKSSCLCGFYKHQLAFTVTSPSR